MDQPRRRKRRRRHRQPPRGSPGAIFLYLFVRVSVGVVSSLPQRWVLAAARAGAWIAWRLDARHRAIGRENLDRAFGDTLTADEKDGIILGCYRNMTQSAVEIIHMRQFVRQGRETEFLEIEGEAHVRQALEASGAAIIVSGHMGNWELQPIGARLAGAPVHSIVKPRRNPRLEAYIVRVRESLGQRIILKSGAFGKAMSFLREGKSIGVLIDQNQRKAGIFVDFFGRKASTTHGPALLARRSGVSIVPSCIQRLPGTNRHRQVFGEPILSDHKTDASKDVRRMTQEYTTWFEEQIRETPELWLWVHRRWRTRPPEERTG
jgi:KDO2-lipid IV(A) lauroyltransferase